MMDPVRTTAHVAAQTGNAIAYYALPDVVRLSALRKILRLGILGAGIYNEYRIRPTGPLEDSALEDIIYDTSAQGHHRSAKSAASYAYDEATDFEHGDVPFANLFITVSEKPALGAALAGVAGAGVIALIVATERAILNRGERKRAAGDKFAHLKQGLVAGALTAVTATALDFLDPVAGEKQVDE
ncbi:hypothetical protein [Trueperella sp.]|uniref:hypothetical protein n=1 Tax=Trueperella sp. TaxID=2699835 RepID=UPI00373690A4